MSDTIEFDFEIFMEGEWRSSRYKTFDTREEAEKEVSQICALLEEKLGLVFASRVFEYEAEKLTMVMPGGNVIKTRAS